MRTRMSFPRNGLLSPALLIGLMTVIPLGRPAMAQTADPPAFSQEELSQMLAPIAVYPDSLLSQILMASTYPLEIVQADRWAKENKDLKSEAAQKALEAEEWDPSVKSLVNFPDVLSMLSDKLDWTQKLGDAFISQQKEVMDTIQMLRGKAKAAGNLETTSQQVVNVTQEGSSQVIVIEQSNPEVVYVPAANPSVVYGSWPYPSYPPYPYHPPGYAWGAAAVSFGVGVACGAAWGYAWGNCNWRGGNIDCDFNRNINRNTNINRNRYQGNFSGRGSWQHNASHRKGTPYRNQSTAQRFGGRSAGEAARSRDAFRGRAESGRRDLAGGGADQIRGSGGARPSDRSAANRGAGDRGANRGSADRSAANRGAGNRDGAGSMDRSRGGSAGGRDGALSGGDRGGRDARRSSDRGHSSMGGGGSRGGGGRSSGSRGGGGGGGRGGGRGGGGRGGGGRR